MLRGEVRLTDLEPVRCSEANKRRPAVIVSNDRANATADRLGRGMLTVVPVTSNVTRVFPFQTLLSAELTRTSGRLQGSGRAGSIADRRTDRTCSRPRAAAGDGGAR